MSYWSKLANFQDSFRRAQQMMKESDRVSPKEYGQMLQRRRRKKKKRGGRQ